MSGFCHSLSIVTALTALSACGGADKPTASQPQPYAGGYPPGTNAAGSQPGANPGAYPAQPGAGYPAQPQPGGYPTQQPGAYPPSAPQPGSYPTQQGPQPGQATAPSAQPTLLPGLPPAPASSGGSTAQALDPNLAALATAPLGIFANTEAPGMQKDGPIVAGNFQEGQSMEGAFMFQPGKCYTLVGAGAGVSQLDLEIQYVTPLPGLTPSIGKSSQRGSQASIGGKTNCLRPISPFPAQAKFIVRAGKGAGLAAVQLYSK